jgi:hypothetical protein
MIYSEHTLDPLMNPLKNLNVTARWLTAVFASVLFASVGIGAYNAFADDGSNTDTDNWQSYDHNMTNVSTQLHGYEYQHNYNMGSFGNAKEWDHEDNDNVTKSNSTNNSCGGGESLVNYVGNGATSSTLVQHNLGALPRVMYILDLTDTPSPIVDGITTVISTPGIVYVESGNAVYAPIPIPNTNIVNSTTIDVGQIFNQITQAVPNSKAVNNAGTNYELIALKFASGNCSCSSQPSDNDDDDDQR